MSDSSSWRVSCIDIAVLLPADTPEARVAAAQRAITKFQVRIHGRGGQGVVSAAEMLSVAAFIAYDPNHG